MLDEQARAGAQRVGGGARRHVDLEPLAAGKGGSLLLADCVTSLGGVPVRLDEWGVDLAYSG